MKRELLEFAKPMRPSASASLDEYVAYAQAVSEWNAAQMQIIDAANNYTTLAKSGKADKLTASQRATRDADTFHDWAQKHPEIARALRRSNFAALGLR